MQEFMQKRNPTKFWDSDMFWLKTVCKAAGEMDSIEPLIPNASEHVKEAHLQVENLPPIIKAIVRR